ncbi:tRNA lysidine(34) synthetase TilS [Brevundimonas sp. LM2]|uniref:tRNA lysidine(34) synthetase TilS n=1 Tax=Brevundimonas sp. LM2 TaxID=1938605 RepID=UPI001C0AC30B|nr:tRNA lysidine(34) synthetase TilS [Brevundimonas sp. LM2]
MQRDVDHPVALALSGGGDSMALLLIAADWARDAGRRLLAITVDHGLSPEAADWSRRCARAARAVGADWIECRWAGAKPATGLPAAARRARHALIGNAARQAGARVVLFAHTADDLAESDWMRARGSTLGGLREWSPSPAWPEGRGLMLLRPMLEERREALRDWLRARGQDWVEDPANARFERGRARAALHALPEGEGLRLAEPSDAPAERVRGYDANREEDNPSPFRASPIADALGRSRPLPLGEGFEGVAADLAVTLLCAAGHDRRPRGDRLGALSARVAAGEAFTATLAGARVEASRDRVIVGREAGEFKRVPVPPLVLQPGTPAVWDGRYEITAPEAGWTVVAALGRLNRLSKADRAIAETVPAWGRGALPVLIRDGVDAPVLAWRAAAVRALAPRRLRLALGETTQECELHGTIHGETTPSDLF